MSFFSEESFSLSEPAVSAIFSLSENGILPEINLAGINPDRRFQSCTGQSSKSIGSTLTSVLGAMEPVTAVCVGIFLFGEAFTTSIGVGIALIIVAVMVIILKR